MGQMPQNPKSELGAFYGSTELKDMTVNNLISHMEMGNFTNDTYFDSCTNRGCAVGSAIGHEVKHGNEHDVFAWQFNTPVFVGYLYEMLFIYMNKEERKSSKNLPTFMENIPVGFKDWDKFWVLVASHVLKTMVENPTEIFNIPKDESVKGHEISNYVIECLDNPPHIAAKKILDNIKNSDTKGLVDVSFVHLIHMLDFTVSLVDDDIFAKRMESLFGEVNDVIHDGLVKVPKPMIMVPTSQA